MIYRLLPLLLGAGAVWGALTSFSGVSNALRSEAAQDASLRARIESPRSPDGILLSWTESSEEALGLSLTAAESAPSLRNTARAIGWLREKARLTQDPTERANLLCGSLGLYGAALGRLVVGYEIDTEKRGDLPAKRLE